MAEYNQRQIILLFLLRRRQLRRKKRKCLVRKIFSKIKSRGEYHLLIKELQLFDHEYFFKKFRMLPSKFEKLLSFVGHKIEKLESIWEPIGAAERLCVILRFLVTGDAQTTIASSYQISPTSIGRIIKETCPIIWDTLQNNGYLSVLNNLPQWKAIADKFERKWNFPNCVGAIDDKHVMIQAPLIRINIF